MTGTINKHMAPSYIASDLVTLLQLWSNLLYTILNL